MWDETLGKIFRNMSYKYSAERVKKIEQINAELEKLDECLDNTKLADKFYCSWYEPGTMMFSGDIIEMDYDVNTEIVRQILVTGLKEYKKALQQKKDKLLQ